MTKSAAEQAVGLTEYIIKLPSISQMLIIALVSSLLIAVSASFVISWAKKTAVNFDALGLILILSFVLTLVFSFIFSLKSKKMKFKQLLAMYTVSNVVLSIFLLLSSFGIEFVAIGLGLLFVFWFVISRLVFGQVYLAPIISGVYFIFQIPLAIIFSNNILLFIFFSLISSTIFLAGLYIIFWVINAPVKRIFGVTGISLVSMFFAQWLRGTKELEDIFAKFAEKVKTNVDVVCFRVVGKKGKEKDQILFIIPHLHYGPFGNLGGSAFPHLIARKIAISKYDSTFVFHGTATHDFNPIKSEDVDKITHAARNVVKEVKFESNAAIVQGRDDECRIIGLASKNIGICLLTRAPKVTEDIDFSVGLALKNHAEKFVDKAVIIDAHNAETGELTHVESGSPLVFNYQKAIENAFQSKIKYGSLELGTSSFYPHLHALGSAGVKIALFEIGKRKLCLVLIDANGITPGFRNKILFTLRNIGVEGEVCTTDTHSVNIVRGVINPIGQSMKDYEIASFIHNTIDAVKKAEKRMSKVEFGIGSKTIEIEVFGPKKATELVGTANSIVAVLKWVAPAILFVCGIASYVLIKFI